MPRSPGRTGHQWRKVRQIVLDTFDLCCWCGQPVDKTLSGRDPWGPSVEHLDPLAYADLHGGDPLDVSRLRLAHLRCNVQRGNHLRAAMAQRTGDGHGKTPGSPRWRSRRSRDW